jgi:hypothetical protein
VERFETEQINALRAKGNRVLAVLTHCDLHNVASAIEKMSEILRDDCGLSGDDLICVSSVNKKTLGGASLLGPFGRERAIERIVSDLWGSIAEKIPPLLLNRGLEMIGEWRESSDAIIDDGINFWNRLSDGAVKSAFGEINDAARRCGEKFSRRAEETLREALGYYSVFAEKYSELTTDCPNRTKGLGLAAADMPRLRGRAGNMSLEDKVIDVIAYIIFPFALPYAAGYKRDELKRKLNRHEKCMREWLETRVDEIRARLSGEEDVTEETADMPEMPEVAAG